MRMTDTIARASHEYISGFLVLLKADDRKSLGEETERKRNVLQ